jgi:hypothetical protein
MGEGFVGHNKIYKPDGSTEDAWVRFTCGHCGDTVGGAVIGYHRIPSVQGTRGEAVIKWVLCPSCSLGSTIINGQAYPGASFGPHIQGLPPEVESAYSEARRCMVVNAFTAAELICRKILMHVAVEKKAKEGEPFALYVTFLEQQGYITPPMKPWVEIIRKHGNAATHKLEPPSKDRAESTVMFTAELLRLTYEMEHIAKKFTP